MNDLALGVQVVETEQYLFGDLLDDVLGDTAVLIPLDQPEEVFAEHLEYHADVFSVRSLVFEVVDETDDVMPARMPFRGCDDPLEKLDLVQCRFGIVGFRLDNFERDVPTCAVSSAMPLIIPYTRLTGYLSRAKP
jgi:hypothetical protein